MAAPTAVAPVRSDYQGYKIESVNENVGLVLNEEKQRPLLFDLNLPAPLF
jgi:hypothetical protein